jgi:hypothetical protein
MLLENDNLNYIFDLFKYSKSYFNITPSLITYDLLIDYFLKKNDLISSLNILLKIINCGSFF